MEFKFNIPNKITLIRVALIPLFVLVFLVKIPYKDLLAAFVFAMLSISDFFDGYIARKKKQVTEFGKLIDPIADKLLISTALIFLVIKDYEGVQLWMVIAIIAREIILTAIRMYLLPSKIVVPASHFGKAKTVVQSIAIAFVILRLPFSWYVMFAAVLLTLISGVEYLIRIRGMTGNKVVNLPNLITLARFLMIIPFVYYFLNSRINVSLFIFAAIALSDKLDGISARIMNQKTELGSTLDSFTDWTLIMATLVVLAFENYISTLWIILLVVPQSISGVMKMIFTKKQKVVPVTFVARLGVVLTYIVLAAILIKIGYNVRLLEETINYLLTAVLIMAYLSMAIYIFKVLKIKKLPKKRAASSS